MRLMEVQRLRPIQYRPHDLRIRIMSTETIVGPISGQVNETHPMIDWHTVAHQDTRAWHRMLHPVMMYGHRVSNPLTAIDCILTDSAMPEGVQGVPFGDVISFLHGGLIFEDHPDEMQAGTMFSLADADFAQDGMGEWPHVSERSHDRDASAPTFSVKMVQQKGDPRLGHIRIFIQLAKQLGRKGDRFMAICCFVGATQPIMDARATTDTIVPRAIYSRTTSNRFAVYSKNLPSLSNTPACIKKLATPFPASNTLKVIDHGTTTFTTDVHAYIATSCAIFHSQATSPVGFALDRVSIGNSYLPTSASMTSLSNVTDASQSPVSPEFDYPVLVTSTLESTSASISAMPYLGPFSQPSPSSSLSSQLLPVASLSQSLFLSSSRESSGDSIFQLTPDPHDLQPPLALASLGASLDHSTLEDELGYAPPISTSRETSPLSELSPCSNLSYDSRSDDGAPSSPRNEFQLSKKKRKSPISTLSSSSSRGLRDLMQEQSHTNLFTPIAADAMDSAVIALSELVMPCSRRVNSPTSCLPLFSSSSSSSTSSSSSSSRDQDAHRARLLQALRASLLALAAAPAAPTAQSSDPLTQLSAVRSLSYSPLFSLSRLRINGDDSDSGFDDDGDDAEKNAIVKDGDIKVSVIVQMIDRLCHQ